MIIKKKVLDGKWCKYEGKVEFLIRLFKFSEFKLNENTALSLKERFMYCLMNWKGIKAEDDKTDFECTTENKEHMYDYYDKVREFVFEQIQKQHDKLEKSIKN